MIVESHVRDAASIVGVAFEAELSAGIGKIAAFVFPIT